MTVTAPAPRAYSGSALVRVILLAGGVPVVIAAVLVTLMLLWAPELPDPLAVHWGANGEVDGYGPLSTLLAVIPAVIALGAVGATAAVSRMRATPFPSAQPRFLVAASVFFAVFLAFGIGGSVAMQRGLADATDAGSVFPSLGLGLLAGVAAGAGTWVLTPLPAMAPDADTPDDRVALALAPAERVSWTRSVRPGAPLLWIFLGIFGASIAVSAGTTVAASTVALWPLVGVLALVLAASVVAFFWRVTISTQGVRVRSFGGIFRVSVPLENIAAARVVQVSPFAEFGGWGFRLGAGRTGIVVRSGEGLEVARKSGGSVVVTVDDAETAVALLEGLLSRRDGA